MYQYGPKLPPVPTAPFVRQQAGHSATVPLSVVDVQDVNNVANENNASYNEFLKDFSHAADFTPVSNVRNKFSGEYIAGNRAPGGPVYNTYLY